MCKMFKKYALQSSTIVIIIANSTGPDEMQHFIWVYAAFHLGLYCLSNKKG